MIAPRLSTSVSRRRALAGVAGGSVALAAAARLGAQGATRVGEDVHPIVGMWMLDADTGAPDNAPELSIISADGGYLAVDSQGGVTVGAWAATGDATADITIRGVSSGEDGAYAGMFVIRAAVEVDASGDSFTASYTLEVVNAEGTGTGQYGPATASGSRLLAEPMGEPVGTMDDLFGQVEDSGEPAASSEGWSTEVSKLVDVELGDLFITTSISTLEVGTAYRFQVTNSGVMVHELVIEPAGAVDKPLEKDDMVSEIEDIAPGGTAELAWTFEDAGMYQFACHIPGHYEGGMVVEFEVIG